MTGYSDVGNRQLKGMAAVLLAGVLATGVMDRALAEPSCQTRLILLDAKLAKLESDGPRTVEMMHTMRDQAATQCEQGNEAAANAAISAIESMMGGGMLQAMENMQPPPGAAEKTAEDKKSAEEKQPASPEPYPLGEPRDDLDRFYGLYTDANSPNRKFFVARAERNPSAEKKIPEGYLMVGAMWGDVAPWYMKSVGETRFEQQWVGPAGKQLIVEFEVDGQGNATAMNFESGYFVDRGQQQRVGDLPEGW